MPEILIAGKRANPEALNYDLEVALGALYGGLSTGPYGVRVHLTSEPTSLETAQVQQIVAAHDPQVQSAAQLRRAQLQGIHDGAETQATNIPNFAHWPEQTGLDWIDANIGDTPIDAVTNLAEAKVLMKKQAAAFTALWRFTVAFRNELWPNLQDTE